MIDYETYLCATNKLAPSLGAFDRADLLFQVIHDHHDEQSIQGLGEDLQQRRRSHVGRARPAPASLLHYSNRGQKLPHEGPD
jgi:hypothetical protein